MAEFTAHVPGSFSWVELSTSDQAAGVAFYRALFEWNLSEEPMGPGQVYSMFKVRGLDVAAAMAMEPAEQQAGVPPHWNMYVSVASADETARRAVELGGTVLAPPFDVMGTVGRMAVLQDPTGAVFCVWQAGTHIGVRIRDEVGGLCWSELASRDTARAEAFYTALFGWTAKHSPAGAPMAYTEFSNQGVSGVGMMPMPPHVPAAVPSYWMPYFQVAQVDASTARAAGLGATVLHGPQDIPGTGRFTVLQDPQGAVFAVFTGAPGA